MFGIGGAFKRKKDAAVQASKKLESKDLMEGCVAIGYLAMYADGSSSPEEQKKLEKVLTNHPQLKVFGTQLDEKMAEFQQAFETSFRTAKIRAMKEITDLAGYDPDTRMTIISIGLDIAEAEGDIGEKEMKVLQDVAKVLNVDLSKLM